METAQILENNKLIADFMNLELLAEEAPRLVIGTFHVYDLEYHTSWDWLMPVLEKVCQTADGYSITGGTCIITYFHEGKDRLIQKSSDSTILAVYEAVLEFINWHNQNK